MRLWRLLAQQGFWLTGLLSVVDAVGCLHSYQEGLRSFGQGPLFPFQSVNYRALTDSRFSLWSATSMLALACARKAEFSSFSRSSSRSASQPAFGKLSILPALFRVPFVR
jgi:hypothetical protein